MKRLNSLSKAAAIALIASFSMGVVAQGGLPAEVIKVQPETLKSTIQSIGNLKANQSVVLSPEVSGRIQAIGFEDGTEVEKNAVLFQLDSKIGRAHV